MLLHDHSNYAWFFPFENTSSENATHAIVDWCAAFGVRKSVMSDEFMHFRNETVLLVTKALRTLHNFILPYCPWSESAVERLGEEVLPISRALLPELKLPHGQWPDLLPIFQSVLKQLPSLHLKNNASITAFTGMQPNPPISTFFVFKSGETG